MMPGGFLIYCPLSYGGIAEYAHRQAEALQDLGVSVRVLAARDFLDGRAVSYPLDRMLPPAPAAGTGRRLRHAFWLLIVPWVLAVRIWRSRPATVLLASYSEYLSPFWIWPHLLLRRYRGVRYGANLHDPVRDFEVGSHWWHLLSVRFAYKPLTFVIVHQAVPRGVVPQSVEVHEAPHGIYDFAETAAFSGESKLDLCCAPDAEVLLCFGHLRDSKNVDLLIRALPEFPRLHLVVAGPGATAGQRPEQFYRDLAGRLGVEDRVHMMQGFVPHEAVVSYFDRANWVAVTHAASFCSQSGVLHLAARCHKQILASSGPSPLRTVVERYGLGVFVEPDSLNAIVEGLQKLQLRPPTPDWEGFERDASWSANARVVLRASQGHPG